MAEERMDELEGHVKGHPQTGQSIPAPNPSPRPEDDPQLPNQGDAPLTPGGDKRAGEPAGSMSLERRNDAASAAPHEGTPQGGESEPLPEGGPTQQGEPESTKHTPGGPSFPRRPGEPG